MSLSSHSHGTLQSLRSHPWLTLALLGTLALAFWHARVYQFLTDDAYISFRYADNFARGDGLVFNPGGERVEGYTNFLWVLLLAGGRLAGIPPESAAPVLTGVLTLALWAVMLWFVLRVLPVPTARWPEGESSWQPPLHLPLEPFWLDTREVPLEPPLEAPRYPPNARRQGLEGDLHGL